MGGRVNQSENGQEEKPMDEFENEFRKGKKKEQRINSTKNSGR